jgi:OFA family oxalate/formate antiporter-like MFS transporter
MVLIANLQYAWTLFVDPMRQTHGWGLTGIQFAFSLFIATETWGTPAAGAMVDRLGPALGPRTVVATSGLLVGLGWVINAYATALPVLYLGAAVSGIGAGGIYATCVGNAVKWFPDRRGLAVGLTAAGFGAGAALTVIPIRLTIAHFGYQSAFLWFGLGQGLTLSDPQRSGQPVPEPAVIGQDRPVAAQLHTPRGAGLPGLLADVPDVRSGIGQWPDGHRTTGSDCQGLWCIGHGDFLWGYHAERRPGGR